MPTSPSSSPTRDGRVLRGVVDGKPCQQLLVFAFEVSEASQQLIAGRLMLIAEALQLFAQSVLILVEAAVDARLVVVVRRDEFPKLLSSELSVFTQCLGQDVIVAVAQSCHLLFELLIESLQITHSGVVVAGVVGRQCRHPFLHHKIQSSQRCTIVVGMLTKAIQSGRMVLM